jgi:uncharacterized membrane protein
MKTRQEIKAQAKHGVSQQRLTAILLPVVVVLVSFGGSAVGLIPFIGWIISLVISFVVMVLGIGIYGGFIKIYKEQPTDISELFNSLSVNFLRKLGTQWLMVLIIILGTILFIIPGIILSYCYFMVPYILAECPEVKATDALKLSWRMMKGHKMDVFIMHLSFIGWVLLGVLTLGILLLVYVAPYMSATGAGFFDEIKNKAITDGVVSESELYGTPAVEAPLQ